MDSDKSASPPKGGTAEVNRETDNVLTELERAALSLLLKVSGALLSAVGTATGAVSLGVTATGVIVSPTLVAAVVKGGLAVALLIGTAAFVITSAIVVRLTMRLMVSKR
jgi:hypothetical protein